MTESERNEIFESNAKKLGLQNLLFQTQEECAELIEAISKYNRTRGIGQKTEVDERKAYIDMCREIADVKICIGQLMLLLPDSEKIIQNLFDDALEKVAWRYRES